ncbi:hypothetical protein Q0Z83_030490 [Actinoplanes sichuanensis]|uniref:Nucleotide exchange factor GrpE n=1 Tax=Actinoplanes sichuanensis TaxID=512349 RepID=A0ABW4APM0_9ACTN|nr:hypothetical protein [Actinoplanes sichuanensis]BEL04858.1 hypothetical protein Q0Z83_030490 [Actinoplanes sichuanensis]
MIRDRLDRLRTEWRQRRHHRAFRIPPPTWPETRHDRLATLIAELDAAAAEPETDNRALATAATNLWRARRRLAQQTGGDSAQARQAGRYLRMCQEALADAGLVVRDHDGETFDSGRSLEALVFNDDPDVLTETVTETVRPSVFLREERIQMGQVIVGCPVKTDSTPGVGNA